LILTAAHATLMSRYAPRSMQYWYYHHRPLLVSASNKEAGSIL
jgi:hypothetical protein